MNLNPNNHCLDPVRYTLKPKHTTVSVFLLLLIASGIFFTAPQPARAFDWVCLISPGACGANTAINLVTGRDTTTTEVFLNSTVGQVATSAYESTVAALADLIIWLCWGISYMATSLFSVVATTVLEWKITTDETFLTGWTQVRNLANMLVVLGFVIIGVATTLRIQDYAAKKLLPKLIIVALLVNFSTLFCGLIIDSSNIVMTGFLNSGVASVPTAEVGNTVLNAVVKYEKTTLTSDFLKKNGVLRYVGETAAIDVIYIVLAITFFYLGVLLAARYVIMGILFILSPLAFVFWVFPSSKKLWTSWWEHFIKWAFIGIGASFFIWLGTTFLQKSNDSLFNIVMTMIFMIIGMKIITKSSGFGASAIIGLAGTAAGFAMGGAGVALKGLGGMAKKGADAATGGKVSGAYQRMSTGVGQAMDRLGLGGRRQGTTAQNFQKDMKESDSRIGSMDRADVTKIATGRAFTAQGKKDRISAITEKIRSGQIGDLGNTAQQARLVAEAESYITGRGGVSTVRKDALKQNPNIAANPTELKNAVQNQAPREFAKNIDATALTPAGGGAAVLGAMDDKQMASLANSGSKAKRNAMRDLIRTPAGRAAIHAHSSTLNPAERAELARNLRTARGLFR